MACNICGSDPCYRICPNSEHYYSPERERADSDYNDSLSYDEWYAASMRQQEAIYGPEGDYDYDPADYEDEQPLTDTFRELSSGNVPFGCTWNFWGLVEDREIATAVAEHPELS